MTEHPTDSVSTRNVDIVGASYEAAGTGNIAALLDLLADDVKWQFQGPSAIPFAGAHYGKEGVAQFFSTAGATLEFQQFEPREFITQGDTVVVVGYERSTVKATGRLVEQEWTHIYTLKDGKITHVRLFEDTAALASACEVR